MPGRTREESGDYVVRIDALRTIPRSGERMRAPCSCGADLLFRRGDSPVLWVVILGALWRTRAPRAQTPHLQTFVS